MIADQELKWDAFRSKPRSTRTKFNSEAAYHHYLQWLKLLIFLASHCSCLLAALVSKSIVVLIATNIGIGIVSRDNSFYKKCSAPSSLPDANRLSCLCAALWLIQVVPDVCAFLQDLWRIKLSGGEGKTIIPSIVILECCRAAGLSMLTMTVLPQLDVPRGLLLSCAFVFLPQLIKVFRQVGRCLDRSRSFFWRCGYLLFATIPAALLFTILLSGSYLWVFMNQRAAGHFNILLPLSFVLCAVGYWESWVDSGYEGGLLHEAYQVKYGMRKLSPETRMCACILRFLCSATVLYWSLRYHRIPFGTLATLFWNWKMTHGPRRVFILSLVAIVTNFYLRVSFRFLAAMRLSLFTAGHPVLVTTPLLFAASYMLCNVYPVCQLNRLLQPFGLGYYCVKDIDSTAFFSDYYVTWIWLAAYICWNVGFINGEPTDPSDEVIESMSPMLDGLDIVQSLTVFHSAISKREVDDNPDDGPERDQLRIVNGGIDKVLTVYVCATMWHETKTEMTQMLRSILKLDTEASARLAEKSSNRLKFRLEVHIFFDDAWVDDRECGRIPNEYFKLLFGVLMDLTGSENMESSSHTRILVNTSYGGRLVLSLGAGTLLFVHLKDKKLIRHKKRWSQVMYMYFLLGHRIMDSHLGVEDRQLQAENTYILAIDGDSKFEPASVVKLLHLMNIKSDIGCACGRIHPIGEGVMVWYQKFEYAIAHWFQKAAEHVFGCVLCAPGCFSLFRASALMDDNVMHKYTTTASEPRHFVQYDQGEDRWLSTLLLKQGYRIEYAAASDADTYAPEGFEEFFNQRRRWTPSSIANTLDLLADYKLASNNNPSISKLYILYQMIVIGFSLLGPAIIFTMLVYAQVAAFAMDSTRILIYNAVPVCLFITVCFCFESNIQLMFAKIASIVYAFIMLAVLVATTNQIVLETVFSPTSVFVLAMVLIFLSASFVHPKEFSNIIYGAVFFLMIPSTYVFLSLYSLINLNVINWGTREAVAKAIGRSASRENLAERLLRKVANLDDESSFLARLLLRFRKQDDSGAKIRALERRFERSERLLHSFQELPLDQRQLEPINMMNLFSNPTVPQYPRGAGGYQAMPLRRIDAGMEAVKALDPSYRRALWMDCEYLQCCDRGKLRLAEERFWDELIDKYLKPVESTREEQAAVASGLATLRNRIAFSLILLNGLLVLAVFLLQRHKDVLSFKLTPYKGFRWTKLNEMTGKFEETTEALKLDPLGMGIIFFLLGILIVQTIGMIIHRLNTLVEALHEVGGMKELQPNKSIKFTAYKTVLAEARQMIDTVSYDKAHGADGYVRDNVGEQKGRRNVLYMLQTKDDEV